MKILVAVGEIVKNQKHNAVFDFNERSNLAVVAPSFFRRILKFSPSGQRHDLYSTFWDALAAA